MSIITIPIPMINTEEDEVELVNLWLNYRNVDYQLINDLVFTNRRCATKVYLRLRYSQFHNNKMTNLEHQLFWIEVKEQVAEYVDLDDLDLISNCSITQCMRIAERLLPPGETISCCGLLSIVQNYRNLMAGEAVEWPTVELYACEMLQLVKFEELNNPNLSIIYHRCITGINGLTELQPHTYQQVLDKLTNLNKNRQSDSYPWKIFKNTDSRVIKEVVTTLANYGIVPHGVSVIENILNYGSSAAIELLSLDQVVGSITREVNTFLAYRLDHRIVGTDKNRVGLAWYAIVNGLDIVDEVEWYVNYVVDNHRDWLDDIIKNPAQIALIPCLRLFQYDRQLTHLIAELGGRINISDLTTTLDMDTLEFMITHNYQLTDYNDMVMDADDRVLKRLFGVEFKDTNGWGVLEPVNLDDIRENLKLKPVGYMINYWWDLLKLIDRFYNTENNKGKILKKISKIIDETNNKSNHMNNWRSKTLLITRLLAYMSQQDKNSGGIHTHLNLMMADIRREEVTMINELPQRMKQYMMNKLPPQYTIG